MTNNLFETQYDLTKKSKIKIFYESNKKLIYSLIVLLILFLGGFGYYADSKKDKKILLSEDYVKAKIYLAKEKKGEALDILKNVVLANDPAYSTLSFFLILNRNLINDREEVLNLFDHLLTNNKFDKEIRHLLLYKKALYKSDYLNESELLEEVKPLLEENSLWKAHALILLGDYFVSKKENLKAKDFYTQVLSIKNLDEDITIIMISHRLSTIKFCNKTFKIDKGKLVKI